jgi:hypothetical protein
MQRREFLAASAVAATVTATAAEARAQAPSDPRQFCEWRTYRVTSAEKRAIVNNYLEKAAFPAWGRIDVKPVGAFTEIDGGDASPLHVLLVYPNPAVFVAAREALERDADYQKNAVEYFAAAMNDPAIERVDSWLMVSFEGMPQPAAPAGDKKCTVYELRTYESHNEERARAKIKMFNAGEIEIFRKCGFQPIFFGESLIGSGLPHLKYMLASPDRAAHDESWSRFRNHPDWLAMKDLPEYKDTVSKVSQLFLTPTAYSQL